MAAVRLAVITDSHLCSPATPPGFWNHELPLPESWTLWDEAMGVVADSAVDAIVLLGDVTNFAEPDVMVRALRRLTDFGRPVMAVAGNHDVVPHENALARAARTLGDPLLTVPPFARAVHGFTFAGVPVKATGTGYRVDDAARSVPDGLPLDAPLVVLSHFPLIDRRAAILDQGLKFPGGLDGAARVTETLRNRRAPSIVLHGHLHWQDAAQDGRVLQLGMPALIEWPHAVSIVTVDDDGSGPRIERRTRRVTAPPGTGPGRFSLNDDRWAVRDGRWLSDSLDGDGPI
ncbi:metallophosphoesterase [Actinomadura sp. 7K534]|uniref:metallophosphoesterase family protein n=1 Tax=Actinomadura sp. 7K534 TaxID=2530366 RepID=UPI00104A8950|nr:metallophosphoesterase [Actinomadura sp. 7K534]TDB93928.1 hypothetical protein E1266_18515 [Actinomadura sp. 7K534]